MSQVEPSNTPSETKAPYRHIFTAIRQQINEEFPNLTILFLIYKDGNKAKALDERQNELFSHKAGEKILPEIKKAVNNPRRGSYCAAFTEHTTSSLIGLKKKSEYLGVCFIDETDLELFEDTDFYCKTSGYTAAFEPLHLFLNKTQLKQDAYKLHNDILSEEDNTEKRRILLMADCFAAMMVESTTTKGALRAIVKKYCENVTEPALYFKPENHSLPIGADALNLVYRDLKDERIPKTGLIEHTYLMAKEIAETYDDITLRQWGRFCRAAQDMAWADFNSNEILSAAVFGSDNPYIRACAHICAESLNTNPAPLKNNNFYNPFADFEISERAHIRIAQNEFKALRKKVDEENNPGLFLKAAKTQTKKLIKGNPIGWSAPALIEAENAYYTEKGAAQENEDLVEKAFEAMMVQLKWQEVERLNRTLITAKRCGIDITSTKALKIAESDPTFTHWKNAFEILSSDFL